MIGLLFIVLGIVGVGLLFTAILSSRRSRLAFLRRPDRDSNTDDESAIKIIAELLGEDIGIPASKIYADDSLRKTLGYDVDHLGCEDGFEDLPLVLEPLRLTLADLCECETVGDIATLYARQKRQGRATATDKTT